MRNYPRRLDARQTIDREITVEYAFESFDSEESSALEFSPGLAPVTAPARPPDNKSPAPAEIPVAPTRPVAPTALPQSPPAVVTAPARATLVPPPAPLRASEPRVTSVDLRPASVAALAINPVEIDQPSAETSSALALLIGWFVALSIAALAFLSEGPQLIPTLKHALSRPAAPPAPIVQTHRTEDVYLPSPTGTKPRKAR
jgi:hypothetical protein